MIIQINTGKTLFKNKKTQDFFTVQIEKYLKRYASHITRIEVYLKDENGILLNNLSNESWVILSKSDYEIKNKIAETGKQLKDWKIEFNRGFLTGLNDAFFITDEQRNAFNKINTKNSEIIKPLLRGREIKKYGYSFNDKYVLFPHNGTKEKDRIQVESDYPAIYKHLLKYRDKESELVKPNNKGEIQTLIDRSDQGQHWTNLRNCAYVDAFEGEKLVWLSISDKPAFAFDNKGMHVTAPAYIMTSHCNKYLMTVLNSKTMEWYLDKVSSSTGVGTNQWSKIFVEQLPIPELSEAARKPFENIAEYLIYLNEPTQEAVLEKASNQSVSQVFEDLANMMVYELYFGEEMKAKEIDVLQFVTEKAFPDITKAEDPKAVIQKVYYELQQKDNAIRNRILVASSRSETIARINAATS